MDSVLGDIAVEDPTADSDVEMADATPRAVQKQEKKHKDKKEKKRKSEVNGDLCDKKKKKKTKSE